MVNREGNPDGSVRDCAAMLVRSFLAFGRVTSNGR